MTNRYQEAGVDITLGNAFVDRIKPLIRKTFTPGVITDIGGFGGLFRLEASAFKRPVLVSSTDGVGTKLKIAQGLHQHQTIGLDLVAMCVNDIIVQGATPLFFLDYLATGKMDLDTLTAIVEGLVEGCRQAECALIGGETAEMPGLYAPEEYDLAGFVVGIVDQDQLIDGSRIQPGDRLIGLASNGLHSNGFSLVRKVFFTDQQFDPQQVSARIRRPSGRRTFKTHPDLRQVHRLAVKKISPQRFSPHYRGRNRRKSTPNLTRTTARPGFRVTVGTSLLFFPY